MTDHVPVLALGCKVGPTISIAGDIDLSVMCRGREGVMYVILTRSQLLGVSLRCFYSLCNVEALSYMRSLSVRSFFLDALEVDSANQPSKLCHTCKGVLVPYELDSSAFFEHMLKFYR